MATIIGLLSHIKKVKTSTKKAMTKKMPKPNKINFHINIMW